VRFHSQLYLELPITLAQTTISRVNFAIYENPERRIKIQHPSDWKTEEDTIPHFSVSFIAPTKTNSSTHPTLLRLGVDNLPSPSVSLDNFTNDQIVDVKQPYPLAIELH
jgi:hypothetical protein